MATTIHFIDVGQGNMVLVRCASGHKFVFDCNITDANKDRVLNYMAKAIGEGSGLHAFICSHRDADHMRGIKTLHKRFPIRKIWDSGAPGTSTDTPEYREYMDLRREVGSRVIRRNTFDDYGRTRFRYLSDDDERLPDNANARGIILKVQQHGNDGRHVGSAILPGDSDGQTWRDGVLRDYSRNSLSASVLMAAHHGSIQFFECPNNNNQYYKDHIKAISPDITIVSVGKNNHGHPHAKALEIYRDHSSGAANGRKIYRTDQDHTMKLTLKDGGGWSLSPNQ